MGMGIPKAEPVELKSRSPVLLGCGGRGAFVFIWTSPPPEVALTFLERGIGRSGPFSAPFVSASDSEALLDDGRQTTRFRTWSRSI